MKQSAVVPYTSRLVACSNSVFTDNKVLVLIKCAVHILGFYVNKVESKCEKVCETAQ